MTAFLPHTPQERQEMLAAIGVESIDELFADIPASLQTKHTLNAMPQTGLCEMELQQLLIKSAGKNQGAVMDSFLGGGAYARFIPPAVNTIASRSEFYTAYTPYQPEVSQGTLQVIYEFQSMLSELTGMAVTNASVYDSASAVAESAMMAIRATRRNTVLVSQTLHPHHRQVLQTYLDALGGMTVRTFDPAYAPESQWCDAPETIAAVILQQPDYFGTIRPIQSVASVCHQHGILVVVSVDPVSLALLEPPGAWGADIVCGDIQQFGNAVNFGGPYGGFVSTTEELVRQIPGRLVGKSKDVSGKTAYTLTLQTREQHIRREKATSNICTNQSLNVLKATVYLSLVGPGGLRQVASVSAERAHALADRLTSVSGVTLRRPGAFLNEFALALPVSALSVIDFMARQGILAGIDVGQQDPVESNTLLVAVTELNSWESIARYAQAFEAALAENTSAMAIEPEGIALHA